MVQPEFSNRDEEGKPLQDEGVEGGSVSESEGERVGATRMGTVVGEGGHEEEKEDMSNGGRESGEEEEEEECG